MTVDAEATPFVDFDHHSPEHAADVYGSFADLRERCPFAYSQSHGGYWIATTYRDVARIASDAEMFSSGAGNGVMANIPPVPKDFAYPPLELDPPEYLPYRRLLEPTLTPAAVDAMGPMIQRHTDFLLDRVIESGRIEIMRDFALPLPAMVTLDWLGLPVEDWQYYSDIFHQQTEAHTRGARASAENRNLVREVEARVREELVQRRERPGERRDVLDLVGNAIIDGEPISEDMAVGTTMLLLAGGVNTTADLAAHAILYLNEHRDVHQRLLKDDRFMRTATEEWLRFTTPVLSFGRRAARDVEIGGHTVKAGEYVLMGWVAADHDPEAFDDPDEFVLERWPNRHLAFGLGPHRCLGSNLARSMFKVMIRTFLRRMPDYRVVEVLDSSVRGTHNHLVHVKVEYMPGPRVTA